MTKLFRITAFLEGLSMILLLIGTYYKYTYLDPTYVKMFGMPHGLLFIAYVVLACILKPDYKWDTKTFTIVLIASIIPFGTFYIDKKYL